MGTLIQTFPDGGSGGASARMIADEFSTSVDYAVGDLVIYDKTLYKFTSAHFAGAWDPSDVTDDVTVDSELKLKQNLSDTFNGTLQQWEALPLATKLTYKYANITNDPTEQLEIVSADIDIENHVVHLDGDELVGLNGIWKTQGEYGVKNLIPYPYYDGTSKTITGITYTVNSDGSVTANGTSTGNALFYMVFRQQPHNLKTGRYKISGCPSGGSIDTYYIWMGFWNGSSNTNSVYETGNGATIDVLETSENLQLVIECVVKSGSNMDGKIFKPMLRVADDTDDTYRPYAKTNKQLTDEISGNASDIDEIDERLDNTTTAVTGNPISISGLKSNQLAKDPIITFEPIQAGSGDPSPNNVRAISGYDKIEVLSCGKNIWNLNIDLLKSLNTEGTWTGNTYAVVGVTFAVEVNSKGIVTKIVTNGTPSSGHATLTCYKSNTSIFNGLQLRASGYPTNIGRFLIGSNYLTLEYLNTLYDSVGTIPNETSGTEILIQIMSGQTANNYEIYPMLTLSSVIDTTFEPYNPLTNIQLTLGQTIYGGTLDVEKGILTVDRGIVDLSTLSWVGSGQAGGYYCGMEGHFVHPSIDIVAEKYTAGTSGSNKININDGNVLLVLTDSSSSPTGKAVLKINPYTIQLTPREISLLKDYAYVSTNGTSMSFSYHNGEMASLGDVSQLGETVNELGDYVKREYVSVDITTSMTYGQGLAALYSKIDMNKVTVHSKLIILNEILYARYVTSEHISFIGGTMNSVETAHMNQVDITSTTKQFAEYIYSSGTINDISNLAAWTNGKIILYY